jgi:hypothetical protein
MHRDFANSNLLCRLSAEIAKSDASPSFCRHSYETLSLTYFKISVARIDHETVDTGPNYYLDQLHDDKYILVSFHSNVPVAQKVPVSTIDMRFVGQTRNMVLTASSFKRC